MASTFLLYGATGYTGSLTARAAVQRELKPILAGRNPAKVKALADELGLAWRAFPLDDGAALNLALREVPVVLHCAGPYSRTYQPMVDACLRTGTHYLDITGELMEHEALAGRDAEAKAAGVMLLPSVGFDVVPSDCLAAHLKRRLPSATRLTLAFQSFGGASRGTMISTLDAADRPGMIRRAGALEPVPAAWKTRMVDFGHGPVSCTTLPWGDLATAYRSTGIPNIETYIALPAAQRRAMKSMRYVGWLLGSKPGKATLMRLAQVLPAGPTDTERAAGYSLLWGEVCDDAGKRAVSRMRTPHGYTLTALASLAVVERVLGGDAPAGYQTPAKAYGADFVLELAGVTRSDEPLSEMARTELPQHPARRTAAAASAAQSRGVHPADLGMDASPLLHQQLEGCRDLSFQPGRAARRGFAGQRKAFGLHAGVAERRRPHGLDEMGGDQAAGDGDVGGWGHG